MSQAPTIVEAVEVARGSPTLVDATRQIVGAVAIGTQIFVVTAQYDSSPPETGVPTVESSEDPGRGTPRRKRQ